MSQGGLIEGIAQDAQAEARRLVEEAEKAAAERRAASARRTGVTRQPRSCPSLTHILRWQDSQTSSLECQKK